MESHEFWRLVEEARAPGRSAQGVVAALVPALAALEPSQIEGFQGWLDAYRYAAARKELWAAAFYVKGGCSDDSFDYFRAWLIAQGQEVFLAAMHDPGSLAEHRWPGGDSRWPSMSCEPMMSAPRRAYELVTGKKMGWERVNPRVEEESQWPADRIADYNWTDADTIALFPALAERWPHDS